MSISRASDTYAKLLSQERVDRVLGEARFLNHADPLDHRRMQGLWDRLKPRLANAHGDHMHYYADAIEFLLLLNGHVEGTRLLDVGCGSPRAYPAFQAAYSYPPVFAEALQAMGARVTGLDIRDNPRAGYEHMLVDVAQPDWPLELGGRMFSVATILNVFDAPQSPFAANVGRRLRLASQTGELLHAGGILYMNRPVSRDSLPQFLEMAQLNLLSTTATHVIAIKP